MPRLIDRPGRRRQIVHAAWTTAAANGVHAVTLQRVADAAGIVVGSVRHLFPTREALLFAMADDLVEHTKTAAKKQMNLYARSDLAAVQLIRTLPASPDRRLRWRVELALRGGIPSHRHIRDALDRCRRIRIYECGAVLETLAKGLDVPAGTIRLEALRTAALLEGLGDRLATDGPRSSTRDDARSVMEYHLDGIREGWVRQRHNTR